MKFATFKNEGSVGNGFEIPVPCYTANAAGDLVKLDVSTLTTLTVKGRKPDGTECACTVAQSSEVDEEHVAVITTEDAAVTLDGVYEFDLFGEGKRMTPRHRVVVLEALV